MKLYIANKMSGIPDANFPWFDRARDFLTTLGHEPVSPADMDRADGITESVAEEAVPYSAFWRARLRKDAAVIAQCDGIAFGPLWTQSPGSKVERSVGYELGIPFYRVDPDHEVFSPEMVVGLSGYATVGKDTAADALEDVGWTRRGFAAALKDILYATNPIAGGRTSDPQAFWRVQQYVDQDGWVDAKRVPEIRQLLQRLGTEGGRQVIGEDFWVRTLYETCTDPRIVIPDVRFPNEARSVEDRGGVLIRIERPGRGPINSHPSETALDGFEFKHVVQNTGTPEEMGKKVLDIVGDHYGKVSA